MIHIIFIKIEAFELKILIFITWLSFILYYNNDSYDLHKDYIKVKAWHSSFYVKLNNNEA